MLLKRSIIIVLIGYVVFIAVNTVLEDPTVLGTAPEAPRASEEKAVVEKALRDYNEGLVKAYANENPNDVGDLPVTRELEQEVITDILYQMMKQRKLNMTLIRLDIKNIGFMGTQSAHVRVHEVWEYAYEYKKGAEGPPGGKAEFDAVYTVIKTEEGWKVATFLMVEGRGNVGG